MKIGIFGGSFNPIHNGHIELGLKLCQMAELDQLWFLVSPQNPFKREATDLAPEEERLRLAQMALAPYPSLVASDFEFHLPRPSYMVTTLEKLRTAYPEHEFTLVIGADNWLAFDRWHKSEEILANHHLLIYPRRGYEIEESTLPQKVKLVHTPLYDISSTEIRRRIDEGKTIYSFVPTSIASECAFVYQKK